MPYSDRFKPGTGLWAHYTAIDQMERARRANASRRANTSGASTSWFGCIIFVVFMILLFLVAAGFFIWFMVVMSQFPH